MQAKIKKKKISDSQSCINNPRKPFSEKKYSIAHLLARNRQWGKVELQRKFTLINLKSIK